MFWFLVVCFGLLCSAPGSSRIFAGSVIESRREYCARPGSAQTVRGTRAHIAGHPGAYRGAYRGIDRGILAGHIGAFIPPGIQRHIGAYRGKKKTPQIGAFSELKTFKRIGAFNNSNNIVLILSGDPGNILQITLRYLLRPDDLL